MLVKVHSACTAGCSHCMENATRSGASMGADLFERVMDFTRRMEEAAWALGAPRKLLLSGGECTEHPDLEGLIARAMAQYLENMRLPNTTVRWSYLASLGLRSGP